LRKQLRDLIDVAKLYSGARSDLDQARMQLFLTLAGLSEKTPIHQYVGSKMEDQSLITVTAKLSQASKKEAVQFTSEILAYLVEWEALVSKRVDKELDENRVLHERLNYYQNKVEALRKKTVTLEEKGKAIGKGLNLKLERNEGKLDQAWNAYERHASRLCHLLEEVTKSGWKDFFPVVSTLMTWETKRASDEFDIYSILLKTKERMAKIVAEHSKKELEQMQSPPPLDTSDHDSQTTSSYHADNASTTSSTEIHENAPASPTSDTLVVSHDTASPKSVAI
jgi:hypothetical protein